MIFLTLKSLFQTYFPPLYLPLALSCLPNVLSSVVGFVWTLPPATRSCSVSRSQTELRCTCSFLLLNSAHQSRRCLSTRGARPLSALHMQPETIDQQAAGTGAGLGPSFYVAVTETSEEHGCVPVLEAFISVWPGESAQMTEHLFIRVKCSGGLLGVKTVWNNRKYTHRGYQGEDSVGAGAGRTEISRARKKWSSEDDRKLSNMNNTLRVEEACLYLQLQKTHMISPGNITQRKGLTAWFDGDSECSTRKKL